MTTFILKLIAMFAMTLDHAWGALYLRQEWLTCVGRLSYPIFAFLTVESFMRTSDRKKYLSRMVIFALISEIPFDLMHDRVWFYPFHQNVLVEFTITILGMMAFTWAKKLPIVKQVLFDALIVGASLILSILTFADFFVGGILTIYIFYFFRGKKWWQLLGQFIGMYYVNITILGGYYYNINVFGYNVEFYQQAFAMFALIPIWLYNGKRGYYSNWFKYFCYLYYPLNSLVLYIIPFFMK